MNKKISKKAIAKVVKKGYKAGREWCQHGHGRYHKMMLDTRDGDIWSDEFLSTNDWKEYHSNSIVTLNAMRGYVKDMEAEYIDDAVQKLKEAGWEITE
ncbi:hypothetical protein LQE92_13645 [Lacrimispora sp. NSJ-141]|uniref:Uncharacterized protein n=1 Tax=Lientehia hominis TaxID=2897778 RepID=A0AAP2RLT6_9FIRM|nr:hypothetical protein [Lientehia hominis]MCD2493650.1 hypothetical protein [Lientehia hominis]